MTVEFVASVDRSTVSDRTEIGDASEAGGGVAMEKFLRDHSHRRRARVLLRPLRRGLGRAVCARHSRPTRRRPSDAAVALIGTLDTKGDEIAYVRDRLAALGVGAVVIDSGILGEATIAADVGRRAVARAARARARRRARPRARAARPWR